MPLNTILTTGWQEPTPDQYNALQLHLQAECATSQNADISYRQALLDQIHHPERSLTLDNTFRPKLNVSHWQNPAK